MMTFASRHTVVMALLVGCTFGLAPARATDERSFVLRVGRVLPVSTDLPWSIEPGVIVVRDGRIVSVGERPDLPPDLRVIDLPAATVMPGLVAAATSLAPAHTGDESIAAGYRAIDAYRPYRNDQQTLAGGVTTVHLTPGYHRLITGQGAVLKIGGPLEQRVLRAAADLTINFGDDVFDPPREVNYQAPSSSDVALPPAIRQRPDSRMGQYLAIDEALALSEPKEHASFHLAALADTWQSERPLRVHVERDVDVRGALAFLKSHGKKGYLVGGAQAYRAADRLREAGVPLVFLLGEGLGGEVGDIGFDPDAFERDPAVLEKLRGVPLALAVARGTPAADLRLAAATALRGGRTSREVIESITRIPAEILGVADRVGSLSPGMDADLVLFSGDPLATTTHVQRVYVGGEPAFEAPDVGAIVVHAGTLWVDEEKQVRDGSILIENGIITAVGRTVPHPPFARFLDAGPGAFVTPGLIDAHGHLGLYHDRSAPGPELSLSKLVGVPDVTERRVALAGVTTVILSPYQASPNGSRVAAVKTAGSNRKARVVRDTAGVLFDLSENDPVDVAAKLKTRLEAGKKYVEKWTKYEKELAEWLDKKAKGESVNSKPKSEVREEQKQEDPITGTWSVTVSGGPLPEPQSATMTLSLSGSDVEGTINVPGQPERARIVGTFDGKHLSAEIDIDTGGQGHPQVEADLVEEDHLMGVVTFQGMEVSMDAVRTDKEAGHVTAARRRTRGKGGRPLPPKVDESLEPLRAVLSGHIPAIVAVRSPAQIAAVMKTAGDFEIAVVLLGADDAAAHAQSLAQKSVGVIVPSPVVRKKNHRTYNQADDLARKGVPIAFQSRAEDAARSLPAVGLHAVEQGLSADAALAGFTTQASRMFKLDGEIGSLEAGKQGDLVIFSGHPFEAGSRVLRVIVGGEEIQ